MKLHQWQAEGQEHSLVDALKAKKRAVEFIRDGDRVVDVGCGDCSFFDLVRARRKDCVLQGFDIIPEALRMCKEKGYVPLKSLRQLKGKLDVITLFECFEHLDFEGRKEYARLIRAHVKEDGFVVLSFPHIRSLLSIVHYYDNPEHKEPFPLERTLLKFFEGFRIVERQFLSPWLNPLKVAHCIVTGLGWNAVYNNVCFVLQKERD